MVCLDTISRIIPTNYLLFSLIILLDDKKNPPRYRGTVIILSPSLSWQVKT